jgi:diaminopimelate decarboxylase
MKLKENNIYFYINRNKLINNFNGFSKLGSVYYPLKSNSNKLVLKILKGLIKSNNGFLISYMDHYDKLKRLGINANKMCMINVLAEDKTIEYLYKKGVSFFTFDNLRFMLISKIFF